MTWELRWSKHAEHQFVKLDRQQQRTIGRWLSAHIDGCDNPRAYGKALSGNLAGYWRYRIGNYRVICELHDTELVVLAVSVLHRGKAYAGATARWLGERR